MEEILHHLDVKNHPNDGILPYQLVQDFFHQQYESSSLGGIFLAYHSLVASGMTIFSKPAIFPRLTGRWFRGILLRGSHRNAIIAFSLSGAPSLLRLLNGDKG